MEAFLLWKALGLGVFVVTALLLGLAIMVDL